MKSLFVIDFVADGLTITKRDGTQCLKQQIRLREFGGKYEDSFVATYFSTGGFQAKEDQLIAGSLRFTVRSYEGQDYQDCVLQDYQLLSPPLLGAPMLAPPLIPLPSMP